MKLLFAFLIMNGFRTLVTLTTKGATDANSSRSLSPIQRNLSLLGMSSDQKKQLAIIEEKLEGRKAELDLIRGEIKRRRRKLEPLD